NTAWAERVRHRRHDALVVRDVLDHVEGADGIEFIDEGKPRRIDLDELGPRHTAFGGAEAVHERFAAHELERGKRAFERGEHAAGPGPDLAEPPAVWRVPAERPHEQRRASRRPEALVGWRPAVTLEERPVVARDLTREIRREHEDAVSIGWCKT